MDKIPPSRVLKRVGRAFWMWGMLAPALLVGVPIEGLRARAQQQGAELPSSGGSMEMKLRRLPDAVELVIEGAGEAPQLQQQISGSTWQGLLTTTSPNGLRRGPQRLSLPEAGLQTISIEGSGTTYRLSVTPVPGAPLGRPVVSADGRNLILSFTAPEQPTLQTLSPNITTPGRVPQPSYVPPLQPRAVAPPVGDMAVGTMMLSNPSYVNVSGPRVTMTLKNAPAKDVLMAISRLGGYGFVFVNEPQNASQQGGAEPGPSAEMRPLSIAFRSESYGRALNSALLAAGLQGKREGNMILAGPNVLGKSFGAQMSKVYRLNQASANSAADYLANLGATINKTFTTTSVTSDIQSAGTAQVGSAVQTSQTAQTTQIESYGASQGPLRGLIGTTDSRLGTITLVGDPKLVAVAETYLKQLDLRQRQVALAVKILDVDLTNDSELANSFAFRYGNNFIVNDNGQLIGAFGRNLPPGSDSFDALNSSELVNQSASEFTDRLRGQTDGVPFENSSTQSSSSSSSDFNAFRRRNPGTLYDKDNFVDFIRATIQSRTTKVLASPTLILQENASLIREEGSSSGAGGSSAAAFDTSFSEIDSPIGRRRANEGVVRVGVNVPTSVESTSDANTGGITCTIELTTAGLVLGARIEKIDDNGFVTFSLSPSISAVDREIGAGNGCPPISILRIRRLDTGAVRVRDGQTLILTGVISETDIAEVSKWPILGDIPLIGQFFRASGTNREKRELVIMVTPRIIQDTEGGVYGYGYQPSTNDTRQLLRTVGN